MTRPVVFFMDYDNTRDRFQSGFDAGLIVDGEVIFDQELKEYVIRDAQGVGFSVQSVLKSLINKRVRITCVSFDSIEQIEKLMSNDYPVN